MEIMRPLLLICFFFASIAAIAQKKVIDASAYNDWKRIGDIVVSADGKYSSYTIRPLRGDGYLFLVNNETGKKDSIARGLEPQFSGLNTYLVFKINPGFDTLHKVELDKVNKDKWPKDSLGIWFLANDSLVKIPKVKEYKLSPENDWLAYLSTANELPKGYLSKKELKKEAKTTKKKGAVKTDGKVLTVWHPQQKKTLYYRNVTQFDLSKNGAYVAFAEQQKYKKDSLRLCVLTTGNENTWRNDKRYTEIAHLNFGFSDRHIVGLYTTDTTEQKRWNAFLMDCSSNDWKTIVDTNKRFETNRMLSGSYRPRLLNNDRELYFGVWNAPKNGPKDTLLESEKVKLDLWHWKDARMQPQQLVDLKTDQAKSNLYVYHLADEKFVQLGRDTLKLQLTPRGEQRYILAYCDDQYDDETWQSPTRSNYYRVSVKTGEIVPLHEAIFFNASLSPRGNYFVFFNEITRQLYAMDVEAETETCITCSVNTNWLEDLNGMPMMAGPRGLIGWAPGDKGAFIESEHDIWYYDFDINKLLSVSEGLNGKAGDTNTRYSLTNMVPDSITFYPENLVLSRFDLTTKAMTIYRLSGTFPNVSYSVIDGSDHNYTGFKKAKNAPVILFQRHSVKDYPDLHVSLKPGVSERQISLANPQQSQYNWSTVELISWNSYEGISLQGLVYKPENFDPNQSYPLLVYYYELLSDEIHDHYAPRPTASVIHPTEYASAGYVVFIPDIRYKPGHPANSAYDCVMSGTDAVLRKYPNIDTKRMGLQGQSWGGYQTAQLITMTDRYAAAMAGAPVGDMFSAYGGIRWGSGLSRQFQYEHTQSRIGKTIWEAPELYIENSPVFHLPDVKTPLLIMHNDGDGAVPWYQGIELYTGLRRLGKPVWLLNYNGDDHNLLRNANRVDLSIRMRQFFDYYLLEQPMPLWLKEGIPAIEKGKELRLQKIDE